MDGFFVLLGLAAIVGLLLGPIGFFLTLGARERLRDALGQIERLEARVKRMESSAPSLQAQAPQTSATTPEQPAVRPASPTTPTMALPGAPPAMAARAADPDAQRAEPASTPPAC